VCLRGVRGVVWREIEWFGVCLCVGVGYYWTWTCISLCTCFSFFPYSFFVCYTRQIFVKDIDAFALHTCFLFPILFYRQYLSRM
jgi:hypothetical protein